MRAIATEALRSLPRAAFALPPAVRRALLTALAVAATLAAGYFLWFRDSTFARVKDVYVSGVSGPQARAIRSALENAGLDMTTLHVDQADLEAAVVTYPVVRSVTAEGDFPHTLRIDVDLNLPVAVLETASGRKPVAADGLFLTDVPVTGHLPVLSTKASIPSDRVTGGPAFALLRVVSVAPAPLRRRIRSVEVVAGKGIVADLYRGPDLIFGSAERMPAKWAAASRVLAAAAARGASYVDLRLPERPAAGGLPTTSVIPLAPAGEQVAPTATGPTQAATETTTPTATTPTQTTTQTTTTPTQTGTPQSQTMPAAATTGGAAQAPTNPQSQVDTTPQP